MKKLIAAIACRNRGSRLYGKPLQNLDQEKGIRIIDNIIDNLKTIKCIDDIVFGISDGQENEIFKTISKEKKLNFIVGDETDVLKRLILCGEKVEATDIFRITSESPFLYYQAVEECWSKHCFEKNDATFYEDIVDGCGFEIISLSALKKSHELGNKKHRSELCTLFIRENLNKFKVRKIKAPKHLCRKDLRLTVDNPEDLVICREVYNQFIDMAPKINLEEVIKFLDNNPELKKLTLPYTIDGYNSMYL